MQGNYKKGNLAKPTGYSDESHRSSENDSIFDEKVETKGRGENVWGRGVRAMPKTWS